MRKSYNIIFLTTIIFFSLIDISHASFWADDDFAQAGMDTSKWEIESWPASSNVIFEERGDGNLNFYTNGPIYSHTEVRYFSKWYLDTSNSFQFKADFYLNHQGQENSGLYVGLANLPSGTPGIDVFGASNVSLGDNMTGYHAQYWSNLHGQFTSIEGVNHNYTRGRFVVSYDDDNHNLLYQMFPLDSEGNIIQGVSFERIVEQNLNDYGNYWRVELAGTTEAGGQLSFGEAYFEDFRVLDNTVVPEPATMFLFGLGGVTMVFIRRRKQRG